MINTVYGIGGWCENCDTSHDHPLNNILEEYEYEPSPEDSARISALSKLAALGLTEDEISALLGNQ